LIARTGCYVRCCVCCKATKKPCPQPRSGSRR
jgi:hypothetical protein